VVSTKAQVCHCSQHCAASARKKLKAYNISNSLKDHGLKSKFHILLERPANALLNVSTNKNPSFDNGRRHRLNEKNS